MGHIRTIEDFLILLNRRWKVIALCAMLAVVLAVMVALKREDRYTAWASIEVQSAQVETQAAAGLSDNARIQAPIQLVKSLQHRLSSRPNLIAIIERHGLFANVPAMTTEKKVELLRGAINFVPIEHGYPPQISAVVINVTFDDAENAARIANDLAQSVVDLSASAALTRAQESFRFHSDRLQALTADIDAQEARIVDWRTRHSDVLPPVSALRREEQLEIEAEMRALDRDLLMAREESRRIAAREVQRATDRQRLADLEEQSTLLEGQLAALRERTAAIETSLAGVAVAERGLTDLERGLEQIQRTYELASAALAEADAEVRLADRQQGDRFGILDRAITPEHPQGPRRLVLVIAGAIAGVIGGLVLAFIFDLMKPVIRTSAQMERELGLRPIIALPEIQRTPQKQRLRLS